MRRLFPFFVSFLSAACLLDFDQAGPQGGSAGTGGVPQGTAGGGGEPSGGHGGGAPCDGECVVLPEGFSRVVRLTSDECAALIEGGLDDVAVSAEPAVCQCSCVVPDDLCQTVRPSSTANCTVNGGAILAEPGPACTMLTAPAASLAFTVGGQPTASCGSDGVKADKPPITWEETTRACAVEGGCDAPEEACMPSDQAKYCLLAETATECPEGYETHRLHAQDSYVDSRDCECQCNGIDGSIGCGEPTVVLYASSDCSGQETTDFESVTCAIPTKGLFSSFIFTRSVSGSCNAPTPLPSGDVVPSTSGQLLCCN